MLEKSRPINWDSFHLTDISDLYTKELQNSYAPPEDKRKPGIHASEISGCKRKAVYTLLGADKVDTIDLLWQKRFELGHLIHRNIQKRFHEIARKSGGKISFTDEVVVNPQTSNVAAAWNIQSACDGIIRLIDSGIVLDSMILEIKSISPSGYTSLREPEEKHTEQAHVYMACLGIHKTYFMYVNKSTGEYTPSKEPWVQHFDEDRWVQLTKRFAEFHELAETGLPDPTPGFECQFCSYRHICPKNDMSMYKYQKGK